MAAPGYASARSALTKNLGLGRKPLPKPAPVVAPEPEPAPTKKAGRTKKKADAEIV